MKILCNKSNPPLGGLLAVQLYKAQGKSIDVAWGNESTVTLPNAAKPVPYGTSNDLIRIIENAFNKAAGPLQKVTMNHWLSFSLILDDEIPKSVEYLDKTLGPLTYLVGETLSVSDLAVFSVLYVSSKFKEVSKANPPQNILRWMKLIEAQPAVSDGLKGLPAEVLQNLSKASSRKSPPAPDSNTGRLQEGKFVELPHAEMGKVIVRFPPEASGYLHIGHAKAALLNQYYQQAFQGKLIMRFDDTNPAKENADFEKVILEDVEMLEIKPDMFTHTSQYFDLMLQLCEKLIKEGKAFVDDTPAEQMKSEREQKQDSRNRNNSVEKNLQLWEEMKKGSDRGTQCCVRAKIDMQSANGCMRDPTIYRCKPEEHPRTGTQYKVYPTYDFACPIVDSIEGVTHVLRTMEYHDRDPQFYWFIEALGLRKPYIWEYSRLSMTNTVLSKRKLTWFVEQGHVDGWDDPRMPTVRGVLRRGMTVEGLRQFIQAQGSSRSVVFMEWDKIWAINKKVIDPVAPRYTALEASPVPVNLKGVPESTLTVALHPKNPDVGSKTVWVSNRLLIDQVDAQALKEGENATFINYGNIMINKIHKAADGNVTSVDATPNLENKDYKKTLKLTWLADAPSSPRQEVYCVYFDHIISKPLLGKDEDFKQYIGHKTRWEIPMLGEPALSNVKVGDIIQLQRRGFFRVDVAPSPPSPHTARAAPLVLLHVPDGHTKEMPGQPKPAQTAAAKKEVPSSGGDAAKLDQQITKQGDLVRSLKAAKAEKAKLDEAVKALLDLKAKYKAATGQEWKPGAAPSPAATKSAGGDAAKLNEDIAKQGDLVRSLKSAKAEKAKVDEAVKSLLELKAKYKAATGQDWKPGAAPAPAQAAAPSGDAAKLNEEVTKQGDLVRSLKSAKAEKAKVDEAVKALLDLKAKYKAATGQDWKPGTTAPSASPAPTPVGGDAVRLNEEITKQGDLVRSLKSAKAEKAKVDEAVKALLDLKAKYKAATGQDWKPGATAPSASPAPTPVGGDAVRLNEAITKQGDLVRSLKSAKAEKAKVDEAVKTLLELKGKYKAATGQDWKPGVAPAAAPVPSSAPSNDEAANLSAQISAQGDKVRKLKSEKADKNTVDVEVKNLLNLKAQYKSVTGSDWKPNAAPPAAKKTEQPAAASMNGSDAAASLGAEVAKQGEVVRDMKAKKADKATIDAEVKKLLELKAKYQSETGTAYQVPTQPRESKPKEKKEAKPKEAKKDKPKQEPKPAPAKDDSAGGLKKITRLGMEAKKDEDLPEWYSQVITKSEMIDYYDISGCYILRPWSYSIWDRIREFLSPQFKKLGVKDGYFPIFVSKGALEREKKHIEDFAPEVAWVTHSGTSELAEHIAIRPTSETAMYPAFARWIQSHRDLPYKLNQWNNVVRWEFKQPQPFLRTREFLWQEGHTAFRTPDEAGVEVLAVLELYRRVYEELLAVPVIPGRKSEKEKFAGSDYTCTVEGYVPASGRAIQGATSHHLGQNFSKMFEVVYDDPETHEKAYVYQNSWGITTRTIGVMVLVHGDDKGLVLPPRVADVQVVVVPCGITASSTAQERDSLISSCRQLVDELSAAGIRCEGDYRDNYSPGWKFNHWEVKGVPIRVELGPKDLAKGELVAVRRVNGEKLTLQRQGAGQVISDMLERTQAEMLDKATKERDSRMSRVSKWADFTAALERKHILLAPFCGEIACEENIKKDSRIEEETDAKAPAMGAKSLCIPFKPPCEPLKPNEGCIHPDCKNKPKFITLFGRSY